MFRNQNIDQLDRLIDGVEHLPPAPTVAAELLGLFSDPDRDIDRIVELISHDPSLTAEVIKRCNSAFFAGAEPAEDMMEAVTRLGFYEVYCMVIALVGSKAMKMAAGVGCLDPSKLWQHSVVTAATAATLARRVEVVEAVAFTAGLLHDVGKLIFASVRTQEYAAMIEQAGCHGPEFADAEIQAMGVSHSALGARLLSRWKLPENVCAAVLFHHDPPAAAAPFQRLAASVNLANLWAHQVSENLELPTEDLAFDESSVELLQLPMTDTPLVVKQTQRAVERAKSLLSLA